MFDPRAVPAAHSMDTAWFGVDADGNLALFDTGEAGALPEDAAAAGDHARPLGGAPDGFAAIAAALKLPEDLWEEAPDSPVFRYTHDDDNWIAGRYTREQVPARPARIEALPPALREGVVPLPVRFADGDPIQPVEHVPSVAWGAVWLSSDGTVARPFPGREDEAEEEWEAVEDVGIRFERDPGAARSRGVNAPAAPESEPVPPKKPWWKFW